MAIASIDALCKGFCESAGLACPVLEPDRKGTRAFRVCVRGIDITVQQFADRGPDGVFLAADLGPAPEAGALQAWRRLMHANLRLIGSGAPVFSLDPSTQHATLQWACPLIDTDAAHFQQCVTAAVELAERWRADCFEADVDAAHSWWARRFAPQTSADEAAAANAQFDALYAGVSALLRGPEARPPNLKGARGFTLELGELTIRVIQSSDECGDAAFLAVPLGRVRPGVDLATTTGLMETNFHLAIEDRATRICRQQDTGEFLMLVAFALEGSSPQELLSYADVLAQLARQWRVESAAALEPDGSFLDSTENEEMILETPE